MNQVVNFLSLLAVTEEQGGVKRMLGVCIEFERIARVVLERGDKKGHKRRSSKMNTEHETPVSNISTPQHQQQQQQQQQLQAQAERGQRLSAPPMTPLSNNNASTPQNVFSPSAFGDNSNGQTFNPALSGFSPSLSEMGLHLDFNGTSGGADFQNLMAPSQNGMNAENFDPSQFQAEGNSVDPLTVGSFQQPFVPQDLWQMPMTLEWDWSEAMHAPGGFDAGGMNMGMGMAPRHSEDGQQQQQQMDGSDGLGDDQRGVNGAGRGMM